ncbi:Ppx/GppA phosphatase family protein [Hoeflea poritis]|uniref:Ppx/GppA phosphatase family protein n=1 Tax=Hoeflea poritis TaxID=2993659 RepID=A0ABT4VMH8_9HYPH|nr:Ppx/GppA phosphatase family protein [Hoeflea poritis]MDA4845914.1 Ppx/GppA phosphatase family protein [Hoeflea poritis]
MTDPEEDALASGEGALRTGEAAGDALNVRPGAEGAAGEDRRDADAARDTGSDSESRRSEKVNDSPAVTRPPDGAPESGNESGQGSGKNRRRRRRSRRGKGGRAEGDRKPAGDGHEAGPKKQPSTQPQAKRGNGRDQAAGQQERPRQPSNPWRQKRPHPKGPLYAALDLGTNNCRLLVAVPTKPGQFRVVDAFSRIVRLGEGLGATGELSQAAMDRAVEALKVCATKMKNRPVRRHRLIATEACRAAKNGSEFLDRVKEETGLDLEIVNRETEARLAVSGCSSLVGRETEGVVLFDIGGGSSEIAAIDLSGSRSNRLANHIAAWTSLPVGVVTLSERHGGRDVTAKIFADMVEEVADLLEGFACPEIPGCNGGQGVFHLLGTSGTVTTLAGVHLDLPRYDRRRVDGLWLSSRDVDRMTEKLLSWDFHARSSNPCIGSDRADLVLAGCAILEAIRRRWPSERLRVADRGLREGLLTEMMAADGIWRRGRGRRNYYKRPQGPKRGERPGEGSERP